MGKNLVKKNLSLFILIAFFVVDIFSPLFVSAQVAVPQSSVLPDGTRVERALPASGNSQGANYVVGRYGGIQGNENATTDFAADAVGCSAGQILGNIVQSGVSSVISSITGSATNMLGGVLSTEVPVNDAPVRGNTARETNKEVGGGQSNIWDALLNSLNVSWDSIGFCLANATIHYVAQSTINWINSGFEGNPAFVDNPGEFFQDVADTEAGAFIEELGMGFMCSDFAPQVRIALVNDYLNRTGGVPYQNRAQCTFTDASRNLQGFLDDYRQGGLDSFVDFVFNPANRAQTAYLQAQDELNFRLNRQQAQLDLELNWGRGFLSFKDCSNAPTKVVNGKTVRDSSKCVTKTPGQVIENELNNNLDMKYQRLSIADEFDEVVAALVNYLIRTALSETLTTDDDAGRFGNSGDNDNSAVGNAYMSGRPNPTTPVTPTPPRLTATCRASAATVNTNQPVTFSAVPSFFSSTGMTYDWFGGPTLPQNTSNATIGTFFTEPGIANVSVIVRWSNQSASAQCPPVTILGNSTSTATTTPPSEPAGSINITVPSATSTVMVGNNINIEWTASNTNSATHYLVTLERPGQSISFEPKNVPKQNKLSITIPRNLPNTSNPFPVGNFKVKLELFEGKPCPGQFCGEKLVARDTADVTTTISSAISGKCYPDLTASQINFPVPWRVEASGGNGEYSYLWKGEVGGPLNNATSSAPIVRYSTTGRKTGSVTIRSAGLEKAINCTGNVVIN